MPTKDVLVSQKFNNFNYAPGIATYGIDGKTGQAGLDGNNIYFTNCNIISDNGESDIEILADLIRKNVLPVKGSTEKISRKYKNNDLFFDINGIIFKLIDIDALLGASEVGSYINYFSIAGKITVENAKVFASGIENINNRLIFNSSDYSGYDIIKGIAPNDGAGYIDTDAAVNIISNVVNANDNIEMVKMQSIDDVDVEDGKLSVYYKTTENAYYLESNKPIVINSDVKLNTENNTNNEYDNFSTVLTSNDTITYFKHICDKLRYNILYDSDVNRYKLVIYQEDGGSDDLEYLVDRNKTVYGKVYDGENDQILLKLENRITDKIDSSKYYENENIANFKNISISKKGFKFKVDNTPITISNIDVSCSSTMLDNNLLTIDTSIFFESATTDYNSLNQLFTEHIFAAGIISNKQNASIYSITRQNVYVIDSSNVNTYDKNIYVNDGIYKYTFNNNDVNFVIFPLLINSYSIINENPTSYYIEQYPISININNITNENISGEKTIYFEIKHSENVFSIKNILVSTKNNLLDKSDVDKPCIITYLPDSVESVQRFSLLHNTEVFINYQE